MAATRALAARAERLDPAVATTAFIKDDRHGKVYVDSDPGRRREPGVRLQPAGPAGRAGLVPADVGRAADVVAADFTVPHRARAAGGVRPVARADAGAAGAARRSWSARGTRSRCRASRPCTRASGGPAPAGAAADACLAASAGVSGCGAVDQGSSDRPARGVRWPQPTMRHVPSGRSGRPGGADRAARGRVPVLLRLPDARVRAARPTASLGAAVARPAGAAGDRPGAAVGGARRVLRLRDLPERVAARATSCSTSTARSRTRR